jgi:sugar/nucleoside kinase (ribokinase family)
MADVLVFGDINIDLLAHHASDPAWGLDNLVPELVQECGGVGANVAVALAQWGTRVRLAGCVGTDGFGQRAMDFLALRSVDLSLVQRTDAAPTGLIFISVRPDGQRTIFGSRGANRNFRLDTAAVNLDGVAGVHLVGYNYLTANGAEASDWMLEQAHRRGAWVSLDVGMAPAQHIPDRILQVAERVDYLFVGMSEALALYGHPETKVALARMKAAGAKEVVVKLAEKGSLIFEAGSWCELPPFAVESRDSTGSGDAFAAAYLRTRTSGCTQAEAALAGNAAGAAAATTPGAAASMPEPKQILRLVSSSRLAAAWEPARQSLAERLRSEFARADAAP